MDTPKSEPTPEQLADREHHAQVQLFRQAMRNALNEVNVELGAENRKPATGAALEALTALQAEFIAMQRDRNVRRVEIATVGKMLPRLVALRTGAN